MSDKLPNVELSEAFLAAIDEVQAVKFASNEAKLRLYALFKKGQGFDFSKASAGWGIQSRAKYSEWKKVEESGISITEAQQKYVELVDELMKENGVDESLLKEIRERRNKT